MRGRWIGYESAGDRKEWSQVATYFETYRSPPFRHCLKNDYRNIAFSRKELTSIILLRLTLNALPASA